MNIYLFLVCSFKVLVNVMLNVAGAAFAVTAIVLYSIIMTEIYLRNICRENYYDYGTTPSPGSAEAELEMRCLEGRRITMVGDTKTVFSAEVAITKKFV